MAVFGMRFGRTGGFHGRPIARFFNNLYQFFWRGFAVVIADLRGFARKINAGFLHEIFFVQYLFYAAGAGLAGHAVYLQIGLPV